jgi:hypothetical protein
VKFRVGWEYDDTVHQLFIDFKKAYDSVRREVLYNIVAVGERKTGRKNEEQDRRKTLQEQPSRKRTGDAPLIYSGRTALRREHCDMDGATGGGGRVNSVDSRGDVTYHHSFHQYTTLGKHSLPPAVT